MTSFLTSKSAAAGASVKRIVGIFTVIITLGIFGIFATSRWNHDEGTDRIGKVKRDDLVQRVTIAGTVQPLRTTIVTAPYDGYVKKLYVKLGDHVKQGDPLVSIAQSVQASENVFPIRASFSGTVTSVLKSEGQFVRQNEPKEFILRLDDLTKMFVQADAPEIDILKVKTGLEAVMKVSAVLDHNYNGVVREISQAATMREQWGSRTQVEYAVKIEVEDADTSLKPGMTAIVDVTANKKENVLLLEHEFIRKEDGEYLVTMKDGTVRPIEVGLQNETVFEVTKGLKEGDEVRQIDFLKLIGKP